jgi:hypothetical protein
MQPGMIARALAVAVVASLAAASPAVAKTLVSYQESGGIAGISDSMTVSEGGSVVATSRRAADMRRFKLTAADLRALRRDLRGARFSTLHAAYDGPGQVADGIAQTVRYGGHRVTVSTGGHAPARLSRLLARLDRIASRAG